MAHVLHVYTHISKRQSNQNGQGLMMDFSFLARGRLCVKLDYPFCYFFFREKENNFFQKNGKMENFVTAIIIACLVCCERARVWLFKKEKNRVIYIFSRTVHPIAG
jgi:hypothetical protein